MDPRFTESGKPKRHPDTAFRSIADEGGLVVLPGRAEVKVLNPVGIRVFALLDGNRTVGEVAGVIADEFGVEPAEALGDVQEFLSELASHGMLLASNDAPESVKEFSS